MTQEQAMADDMTKVDDLLWNAWSYFCDQLKEAGKLIFEHGAPANAQNRAAGFEYLARYLPKALDQKFNCADPLYPQLFWLQTPTSKSFGDNPDCTYHAGWVDGDHTYRIVGNRGTVKWVSFHIGPSALNNTDIETNWDGSFEITLSATEQPGNWMRLAPGMNRIFIRQFFGEWHLEEPMRIRIECVGQDEPPPPPTPEDVARRLTDTIDWLRADSKGWSDFVNYFRPWPNEFVPRLPDLDFIGDGAQLSLNRMLSFCHWEVEADEALIITVKPPKCFWWDFELNNEWHNSVDYRYRFSSLNGVQAALNDDGTAVIVLAHVDPGTKNWLDGAGYTSGEINQRWIETEDTPLPQALLVKFAELEDALPPGTPRIDAATRREQLRLRKIGVDRRFPT